ncbi:MAG: helix-turn-helix domain-containing protein [Nitratireductor sp.]
MASAVLDRLKDYTGTNTDTELAEKLQTSVANVSKWRQRNKVPYEQIASLFDGYPGIFEFIITGEASLLTNITKPNEAIVHHILRNMFLNGDFSTIDKDFSTVLKSLPDRAIFFAAQYEMIVEQAKRRQRVHGLDYKAALHSILGSDV